MKIIKLIGLICLIAFTFFYTEKIIDVTMNQDDIMIKLKEKNLELSTPPIDAIIAEDNTIIPGNVGKAININKSYKDMKKLGAFTPSLITYEDIYPSVSIYNNYDKYIISGNQTNMQVSLIYILTNDKTIDSIIKTIQSKKSTITFFIDSTFLNNNLSILKKLNNYEVYNYGLKGKYTKEDLIITNNIINTKSNNKSIYCLFINKNPESLNNCANSKMFSLIPSINGTYQDIKSSLANGSIILINNTQELSQIIDYITSKGFKIVPLSNIIHE